MIEAMNMESNENIYLLVNYALANEGGAEELRRVYPELIFTRITPGIYTVQVPEGQQAVFDRFSKNIGLITMPSPYGLNAEPALEDSNISVFHNYPYGALRGTGVLIGFIDTGIDYINPLFQNADGTTRITAIWDQTIPGNPPETFNYGTLFTQEQINTALQSDNPLSVVPSTDDNGHGTFLAGIAAGNDQTDQEEFVGGAPDASIIVVKLRPASKSVREYYLINDGVPAYQTNDILTGMNFVLGQAYSLNMPLVMCLGVGNNFGGHNGSSLIEGYLQGISSIDNVIAVIASGNEGNTGHHYRGAVGNNTSEMVEINVGENEKGFLMYLWSALPNRVEIEAKSPLGEKTGKIPIVTDKVQEYTFKLEQTKFSATYLYPEPFTGSEAIIIRLEEPTPGIWTMEVYGETIVTGEFHVWLSRRDFINEATQFLNPDPYTTVQIPGTEVFSIVVGAYDDVDDSLYVASGRGPTTNGIIKPDIIAPGVNVRGPMPGGGFTTYTGTSVAAAITSSACALLLQWAVVEGKFPQMNTRIARGILTRGARRKKGTVYPNNIEGYGRLDLQGSINTL